MVVDEVNGDAAAEKEKPKITETVSPQPKMSNRAEGSPEVKVTKKDEGSGGASAAATKAAALQARNQSYVQKMLSLPKLVFTEQVMNQENLHIKVLFYYCCMCCFIYIMFGL